MLVPLSCCNAMMHAVSWRWQEQDGCPKQVWDSTQAKTVYLIRALEDLEVMEE